VKVLDSLQSLEVVMLDTFVVQMQFLKCPLKMVQQQLRLIKSLDLVGQDIIVLLEQELLKSVLQENTTML